MESNAFLKFPKQSDSRNNILKWAGIYENYELQHADDCEPIPSGYGVTYFNGWNPENESGTTPFNKKNNCCGGGGAGGSDEDAPVEPPQKKGGSGCTAVAVQELEELVNTSSSFCNEDEEEKTLYVPALTGSDKTVNIISSCHVDLNCYDPEKFCTYSFEAFLSRYCSTSISGGGGWGGEEAISFDEFKNRAIQKVNSEPCFDGARKNEINNFIQSFVAQKKQLNCENCFSIEMPERILYIGGESFVRGRYDYVYNKSDNTEELIYNYTSLFESSCDAGRRCINIDGYELRADGTYITVKTPAGAEISINSLTGIAVVSKMPNE